jgi:hypothetical protein
MGHYPIAIVDQTHPLQLISVDHNLANLDGILLAIDYVA